jgi:RNA polymerase sigma factor (sigma-70 family)
MNLAFSNEADAWAAWNSQRDEGAIEWLVQKYFFIAKSLALRIGRRTRIEMGDLLGAGGVALWGALKRFDPMAGVKVSTFVHHRIKGKIWDEVRIIHGHRRIERPSTCMLDLWNYSKNTRDPRAWEDRRAFSRDTTCLQEMLASDWWDRVLTPLKSNERQVMLLIYRHGLNQIETARSLGYSASAICLIHTAAIDRIKSFGISLDDFCLRELAA